MAYEYRMVQIPQSIEVRGAESGREAAQYLQDLANEQAQEGWEFYRTDTIGVVQRPGCMGVLLRLVTGGLLGGQLLFINYYVVTFRKEA